MTWYTLDQMESRAADLRKQAARERLARVASCCRPSTWVTWLRRLDERVQRSRFCCV
ncbi:MAG: hypothetical protein ACLGIG_02485 [Actinomycetes bacterium]